MAKSKKKRQQDFQKVKLKVGKKLKKADNVTNASFRTRSIQISQTLKTGETSQPSTKKKQNIKELFTQCRHYSSSVRLEAVNGLKELLTSYSDLISVNLSDILDRCSELLIDRESSVRLAVIRLFKYLLPMVTEKEISPFFPLLCAHLSCAMTHIQDSIQEDSLNVLDLMLETFPKLMLTKSNQVLPNFMEQISRRQGQGKAKRTLSTNPDSSTSTVKWRTSVFNRLHKFLSAMVKYGSSVVHQDDQQKSADVWRQPSCNESMFLLDDSPLYIQPWSTRFTKCWSTPGFILGGTGLNKKMETDNECVDEQFLEYTDTLIPLMFECWVECAPSKQKKQTIGNRMTTVNIEMLYSILQVTQLLWHCIHSQQHDQEKMFNQRSKYMKDFHQYFMSDFPFSGHQVLVQKNKKTSANAQISLEMLNLTICNIMTYFIGSETTDISHDMAWLPMVTQYLCDYISGKYGKGFIGQSSKTFVNIVDRLVSHGIRNDMILHVIVEMFKRYQTANVNSTEKIIYLEFFHCKMLSNGDLASLSPDLRRSFLKSLPGLLPLCSNDNEKLINILISTMKTAACEKCSDLIDKSSLDIIKHHWFDPDSGVISRLNEHHQRDLISILYYIPTLDLDVIKTLVHLIRSQQINDSMVSYLIQTLHNRYLKSWQRADTAALHIGFLTNLIIGMSQQDIKQRLEMGRNQCRTLLGKYNIIQSECSDVEIPTFDRQNHILEMVGTTLCQFYNTSQAVDVIIEHFQNTLLESSDVPLEVAFGICKFAESLNCIPSEFECLINQLSISLVSHLVTCQDSSNPMQVKQMKDVCCKLMLKNSSSLDTLFKTVSNLDEDLDPVKFDTILKTVMIFLTEGRHTCIQGHPQRLQLLTSLHTMLQNYVDKNKDVIPSETETLLVNFKYLLSSVH
ncbi:Testis-expressed sequence 10 protein [Mactra antiquata]